MHHLSLKKLSGRTKLPLEVMLLICHQQSMRKNLLSLGLHLATKQKMGPLPFSARRPGHNSRRLAHKLQNTKRLQLLQRTQTLQMPPDNMSPSLLLWQHMKQMRRSPPWNMGIAIPVPPSMSPATLSQLAMRPQMWPQRMEPRHSRLLRPHKIESCMRMNRQSSLMASSPVSMPKSCKAASHLAGHTYTSLP